MKLIGLDVGTRRIGVAVADSGVRIAVPKGTIVVNGGRELQEIIRIAKLNNTEWFVIGMPRSNQGNRTAQSNYVQDFADALLRVFPAAKIRFQDESLTSVEAEERLKARKRHYGKEEIDAEAAAIILQDFIENFKNVPQAAAKPDPAPQVATPPEAKIKENKTKKEAPMIKKTFYTILSIIVIMGIFSFIAYGWYNAALEPVVDDIACTAQTSASNPDQDQCKAIDFIVEEGDTVQKIASKLKQTELIKSAIAFHIYSRTHKIADQLQVGKYELKPSMSTPEIAVALAEGGSPDNVFSFTIYPGETIKDIKEDLINHGYDEAEVNQAFAKQYDHPVLEGRQTEGAAEPLEGYLFGDTYEFYKGESVEKIITTALDEFYQAIQKENLIERLASRGFSLYEGITLASIIQKEANTKDFPTVSQVFQSRLSQGINLGSDVTVQYALDIVDPKREVYTNNTTAVEIDSPYNTRRYAGLTPGPISNPSIQALISVAEPSDTGYLYFLTGDDGMMYYGNTEEEHLRNIQEHCQNFCANSL